MARSKEQEPAPEPEAPKVSKRTGIFLHTVSYPAGEDKQGNPIVKTAQPGSKIADAEGLSAETFAELKALPGVLGAPDEE